jgi:uncharacterized protein (TIGR03905 family)
VFQKIEFELEDGKLKNVSFLGGCSGNLKAIGKLVEGMERKKVISLLAANLRRQQYLVCGSARRAVSQALELQRRAGTEKCENAEENFKSGGKFNMEQQEKTPIRATDTSLIKRG